MIRTPFAALALALGLAAPLAEAAIPVTMQTSLGTIELELDETRAPKTVANFVDYARAGFYDGTVFHRVIQGFMIQGGGFTAAMEQKPTRAPVDNEARNGLKNTRGSIAMARTSDPHSASSQFFINVVDNPMLDYPSRDGWGYAVFGQVVKGMDVVDRIRKVPTTRRGPHADVPETPVVIEKVTVGAPQ